MTRVVYNNRDYKYAMIIQTNIKPTQEQKDAIKRTREATEVFGLWYPRPELGETLDNSPDLARRIFELRKHRYTLAELRKWFRLDGRIHLHMDSVIKNNPRGKTRSQVSNQVWEDIKACYDYKCAYCGNKSRRLTKDHIMAVSRGGEDSMTNIVPACSTCNFSKSSRRLQDWPRFYKLQLHLLGV